MRSKVLASLMTLASVFAISESATATPPMSAVQITLKCEDASGQQATFSFDQNLLQGAQPQATTLSFQLGQSAAQTWTTEMYMVLDFKSYIFVQFRNGGPWDEIDFHLDPSLTSATVGLEIKSLSVAGTEMTCTI